MDGMQASRLGGQSRSGAILRHLPWVILVMVISAGFLLIPGRIKPEWSFGLDTDVRTNLGSSLLGGAVIGLVLLALERQTASRAEMRAQRERADAIARERGAIRHIIEMWMQSVIDEVIVGPLRESVRDGYRSNDPVACDWLPGSRNGEKEVTETFLGRTTTRQWRSVPVFSTRGHKVVARFLSHVQTLPIPEQIKFFASERVGVIRDWVAEPGITEVGLSSRREELKEILRDLSTTFSTRLVDLGDLDGATLLWKARSEVARTPREWSFYRGFEDDALVQSLQRFLELGQTPDRAVSRYDTLPIGTGARVNLYDHAQQELTRLGLVHPGHGFEYEPRTVYPDDDPVGASDRVYTEEDRQGVWVHESYVHGGRKVPVGDLPWNEWLRVTWVESMRQHDLQRLDPVVENAFLEVLESSFECSAAEWFTGTPGRHDGWCTSSLPRPGEEVREKPDLTKPWDFTIDWSDAGAEPDIAFVPNLEAFCSQYWDVFTAVRMVYRKYEHSLTNNFWSYWLPIAQVEWMRRRGAVGDAWDALP